MDDVGFNFECEMLTVCVHQCRALYIDKSRVTLASQASYSAHAPSLARIFLFYSPEGILNRTILEIIFFEASVNGITIRPKKR